MEHIDPKKLAAAPLEPEQAAKAAGLRYVDDSLPGFSRKKVGTGFGYRDIGGKVIRDPEV
ncbi:MAG: DNA topoisomerase IB, partial [Methylobacteriaceae bacterium]|nr:DNA topoisomerase IB [Methylobacteriaceae bacterium]